MPLGGCTGSIKLQVLNDLNQIDPVSEDIYMCVKYLRASAAWSRIGDNNIAATATHAPAGLADWRTNVAPS